MVVRLVEEDLERLGRHGATEAMRGFLKTVARGSAVAPPRLVVPIGERTLVLTVGGDLDRRVAGMRLYSTGPGHPPEGAPDQFLALLDLATGEILATAEGAAFGAWRTAAIGAVALTEGLRGRSAPVPAAVVGAGFQAFHQARAWAATGLVSEFRVFSRRLEAAAEFAARLTIDSGVRARPTATAQDALRGAPAVLCATSSPTPAFPADALDAEAYVATLGPKFGGRHEVPAEVYARAAALVTDAPAQVAEYERTRGALPGGRRAEEVVVLADLVAGTAALPAGGVRLFVAEGLAGTEVALLEALWRARS